MVTRTAAAAAVRASLGKHKADLTYWIRRKRSPLEIVIIDVAAAVVVTLD